MSMLLIIRYNSVVSVLHVQTCHGKNVQPFHLICPVIFILSVTSNWVKVVEVSAHAELLLLPVSFLWKRCRTQSRLILGMSPWESLFAMRWTASTVVASEHFQQTRRANWANTNLVFFIYRKNMNETHAVFPFILKTIVSYNQIAKPSLQGPKGSSAWLHFASSLTFIFPDGQTEVTFTPSCSHQPRLSLFSLTADDDRVASADLVRTHCRMPSLRRVSLAAQYLPRAPSGDADRKAKSILCRAKVIHRLQAPQAQKKLSRERIMKQDWRVANW